MKKVILTTCLLIAVNLTFSQIREFKTYYFKTYNSERCYDLEIKFLTNNKIVEKKDGNNNSVSLYFSGIVSKEYNSRGEYIEIFTSKYALEEFGVYEYNKLDKYSYVFAYDQMNGNLIYVYECQEGSDNGKFYFTEKGYLKYCK